MMKFGTETGSLVNHVMSTGKQNTPQVGEGATLLSWSDRSPGTVISVERPRKSSKYQIVKVQADLYTRIDNNNMSEIQEYEYTVNPEGYISTFRLHDDGRLESVYMNPESGRYVKSGNGGVSFGKRQKYHDFTF